MASVPPPPPPPRSSPSPRLTRELVVELRAPKRGGLRRLGGRPSGTVTLTATELTLAHPEALGAPLTVPAGQVALATIDHGGTADGRFPILRRLGPSQVVAREHGLEGWLWTARHGSSLPALADDEAPNLALLFIRPLDEDRVRACFTAAWVAAVQERSPLGTPAVPGLLLTAANPWTAADAFRAFGVLDDLTDREVPPAMRRHLPGDVPANPAVAATEDRRARTSFAPPGMA